MSELRRVPDRLGKVPASLYNLLPIGSARKFSQSSFFLGLFHYPFLWSEYRQFHLHLVSPGHLITFGFSLEKSSIFTLYRSGKHMRCWFRENEGAYKRFTFNWNNLHMGVPVGNSAFLGRPRAVQLNEVAYSIVARFCVGRVVISGKFW